MQINNCAFRNSFTQLDYTMTVLIKLYPMPCDIGKVLNHQTKSHINAETSDCSEI